MFAQFGSFPNMRFYFLVLAVPAVLAHPAAVSERLAALEQQRADLRFTAPRTLTRRHGSERTEAL